MVLASSTRQTVQEAIDYLRGHGQEEQARAVESLLREPAENGEPSSMSIDAAAARLGSTRERIEEDIRVGLLTPVTGPHGEPRVTAASVARFAETLRLLEAAAFLDGDEVVDPDSLLGQMLTDAAHVKRGE